MVRRIPKILIDKERCINCYTCEVACKQEHNLPVGPRWITVQTIGPKRVGDTLRMDFMPILCMHCAEPACLNACPEKAIYKREDGIVLINEDACTGCKLCMDACPVGAMQYFEDKGKACKCTYCVGRIDAGKIPACVNSCPTHAMKFGDANEVALGMRQKAAERFILEASYTHGSK